MANKILITGASGLVGSRLTELLLKKGYEVNHLGRKKKSGNVPSFVWNIDTGEFDLAALDNVTAIVHLAGAGVADKRWTAERKKEILESRIKSTALLFNTLKANSHGVKTLVSASAIGIYGFAMSEEVFTEQSSPGTDFLAHVTEQWEHEVDTIQSLAIRTVKLRIGIVLARGGGALPQMALPIKLGVGSPLGPGKQYLSWIHLDDLCGMFIKSIEDSGMVGAYNAVVGWHTNKELVAAIAHALKKPLWAPAVTGFVLKIVLGEMAAMVLNGSKVSSQKINATGFKPMFATIESALENLFAKG